MNRSWVYPFIYAQLRIFFILLDIYLILNLLNGEYNTSLMLSVCCRGCLRPHGGPSSWLQEMPRRCLRPEEAQAAEG